VTEEAPLVETYSEQKARLIVEQANLTKEDVIRETGGIDLDNLPKQGHHWVKRGLVMSCEGVHANHRHFLVG